MFHVPQPLQYCAATGLSDQAHLGTAVEMHGAHEDDSLRTAARCSLPMATWILGAIIVKCECGTAAFERVVDRHAIPRLTVRDLLSDPH